MVDRIQKTDADAWLDARSTWWLEIVGRLRPGQDAASATRALQAVQPQIREATIPDHWSAEDREKYLRESPFTLVPAANGFSELRAEYERPLLTVMVVVILVLLIACANIASLHLARANARRQELGARVALGASRGRLLRQLMAESMLLAAPGGLLGLVVARSTSRLLVAQIAVPAGGGAGVPAVLDVSLHWRVLLFTLAVTVATALLFGVAPALRAGRFSPYDAVRPLGGQAGGTKWTVGGRLVVFQVALSLVLVFGAGLFLRTFSRHAGRDPGLAREGILLVSVDAQRCTIDAAERRALYARIREAVAALPGVQKASVSLVSPVSGMGCNDRYQMQGEAKPSGLEQVSWVNAVTPGWFATYGTPLLAGRDFDAHDRAGAAGRRRERGVRTPLRGRPQPVRARGAARDGRSRGPSARRDRGPRKRHGVPLAAGRDGADPLPAGAAALRRGELALRHLERPRGLARAPHADRGGRRRPRRPAALAELAALRGAGRHRDPPRARRGRALLVLRRARAPPRRDGPLRRDGVRGQPPAR
jgi:predicted permease